MKCVSRARDWPSRLLEKVAGQRDLRSIGSDAIREAFSGLARLACRPPKTAACEGSSGDHDVSFVGIHEGKGQTP